MKKKPNPVNDIDYIIVEKFGNNHILMSYAQRTSESTVYVSRKIVCDEKEFKHILYDDLMIPMQFLVEQEDKQWNEYITRIIEDIFVKIYHKNT